MFVSRGMGGCGLACDYQEVWEGRNWGQCHRPIEKAGETDGTPGRGGSRAAADTVTSGRRRPKRYQSAPLRCHGR